MPEMIANQAMPPSDYVRIFDTTLRDGEQSPGATMTVNGEARDRARAGEARRRRHRDGLPAASPDDLLAVQTIAERGARGRGAGRPAAARRSSAPSPAPPRSTSTRRGRASPGPRTRASTRSSPPRRSTSKHKLRMTADRGARRACRHMVALRARRCAPTWSSAPRTPAAASRRSSTRCSTAAIARRGHHAQHPGHRRVHHPDEFGALIAGHPQERGEASTTPSSRSTATTTSGMRGGQRAGGHPRRRAPGRGDHQRHRRARRQHRARGDRDGARHPPRRARAAHRHRHDPARAP